jgi:hypothetical protein
LASLEVLTSYFDPSLDADAEFLTDPSTTAIPRSVHPITRPGTVPLPATFREDYVAGIKQLTKDQDTVIRRAAYKLRQELAYRNPSLTPLDAGSISLVAGCGSRVRIESTADIGLQLRIRVLKTSYDQTFSLRAGSGAHPAILPLSLPPGIVVAHFGGREVARLGQREAPCKPGITQDD